MFDIEDDRCIASFLDSDDVLVEIELNNNVQGLMTEIGDQMQSDNWVYFTKELEELKRIIDKYIPPYSEEAFCHHGILHL